MVWTNPNTTGIVPLAQEGTISGGAAATITKAAPYQVLNLQNVAQFSAYDINAYAWTSSAGAASGHLVAQIVIQWFDDLVSGIPVYEEDWWIYVGRASTPTPANANTLSGCGPMHGQYMSVYVYAASATSPADSLTIQYINVFGSNRQLAYSDWRQNALAVNPETFALTIVGTAGFGTGFDNILANVLAVTATANEELWIPCGLYSGPVYYRFQQTVAANNDPVICATAQCSSGALVPGTSSFGVLVNLTNNTSEMEGTFFAPRCPLAFVFEGNAAGTSQFSLMLVGQQAA